MPVTWTNDIEMDDEGEWNRVPPATKISAPLRDLESDTDWDDSHHIIDENPAHPALRNYFNTEDLFQSKDFTESAYYSEEFWSKPNKNQSRALCDKPCHHTIHTPRDDFGCQDNTVMLNDRRGTYELLELIRQINERLGPGLRTREERAHARRFRPTTLYMRAPYSLPSLLAPLESRDDELFSHHHIAFLSAETFKDYRSACYPNFSGIEIDKHKAQVDWHKERKKTKTTIKAPRVSTRSNVGIANRGWIP